MSPSVFLYQSVLSSTPNHSPITQCIYQPAICPLFFTFLCLLVLLFVYVLAKYLSILMSLDVLFALIGIHQLLCLTILLSLCVFSNRQHLLPDGCQKQNYGSLMTGSTFFAHELQEEEKKYN